MEGINSVNNEDIPDKDFVVKRLGNKSNEKTENNIHSIGKLIKGGMKLTYLKEEDLVNLLWELINRVINTTIGNKVRRYRRQTLSRLNTVVFRTELAVKSEHK